MPELISVSKVDLSYILETTPGTTPATPTFQLLPTVSGVPQGGRTTASSEVIRTDRQKTDLILVDQNVTGTINHELSFTAYRPLLKALMEGAEVSGTDTQSDIAIVAAARTYTSAALADFALVPVGSYVLISGASLAENNGTFRVSAATTLVLTLDPQDAGSLTDASAGDAITISWNHVPNGVLTPGSYTFKKEIALTTIAYMYYRGCMINSINWSFSPGGILTGDFGILGMTEDVTETIFTDQTSDTAIAAYKLMNSVESLAFSSTGLQSDIQIESATLTYDNGIIPAKVIGTLGAAQLAAFTLNCTGSLTLFFEDISAYTLFIAGTSFSLSFKFDDEDGNNIVVFLPHCEFTTVESPVPGRDQFFMVNANFEALRDATLGFTMGMNLLDAH